MVSNIHLAEIARDHMTSWEPLVPYLGLSRTQEVNIRQTNRDYDAQKREFLQEWQKTRGTQATYEAFITAAKQARDQMLADAVRKMIGMSL